MKTKFFLATLILLLSIVTMQAVEINGINYNLYESTRTAEVKSKYKKYTGNIVIPESVTYEQITYSVKSIGNNAFESCLGLTNITIPNRVKSIENETFSGCTRLETLVIGRSVETICKSTFAYCERLTDIYIYAEKVLDITSKKAFSEDSFYKVSRKAALWVPANILRNYQIHEYWGEFDVRPMAAEDANVTEVVFIPQDNSVEMRWPLVDNAETYSLSIKDKQGTVICTLEFNSEGQLQMIVFSKITTYKSTFGKNF